MVGEMRDLETASIAVEASLTGHLVFSTLHTNSASETVTRLLDMGLDPFSFSDSILCVLAQRLARSLCIACRETYVPAEDELNDIVDEFGADAFARMGLDRSTLTLARPVGCPHCGNSGYQGRLGLHELLHASDKIRTLIKRKSDTDLIRMQSCEERMEFSRFSKA
jgi:type II secretory ATPase GspE/PulE/Tfp pilus assembly ATPase PilB-like protein